jgi:RimJ/RimL family protein N-acetyltransferase
VHEFSESETTSLDGEPQHAEQKEKSTRFIGLVTLKSLGPDNLQLPENFLLPGAVAPTTLILELGYSFLPVGWGKGYATESVNAVFEACKKAPLLLTSFSKVYVRAIVNGGNPASMRVMDKTGMKRTGIYKWTGRAFLGGEWRERDDLHIFGQFLSE